MNFRSIVIIVSAILGAILFVGFAPDAQDFLFHRISRIPDTEPGYPFAHDPLVLSAVALIGMVLFSWLGSLFAGALLRAGQRWDRMATGDKVTVFLGIFTGFLAATPVYTLLRESLLKGDYSQYVPVISFLVTVGLSAMSIYALHSMEDVLPWHHAKAKPKRTGFKILDTNVIIDGRIYDVARTGFLEGKIYVPQFVLEEVQYIADSPDALRRQRGRRGLDVLKLMQGELELEVGTYDRLVTDPDEEVDSRLVQLAKAMGGELVTNDVNLNRVAVLQDVKVLNLNDLAMALKPNILPREKLAVLVSREGSQAGQGVGYLDDGTMIVVEGGQPYLNKTVQVMVNQVLQTERGKMIFADAMGEEEVDPDANGSGPKRRHRRPDR